MTMVEASCQVSPHAVWMVLADPWLYPGWVVGASRIRRVDGEWPEVDAVIHHSVGTWPLLIDDTTSVVSSEPDRELVLQARAWPAGEATVVMRLTESPGGCTIVMDEWAAKGPGRLLPRPVHDAGITWRNRESLRRLVFIAEGRQRVESGV